VALYDRMGAHRHALLILLTDAGDGALGQRDCVKRAEAYCADHEGCA
jgi:hypothetical protein